MTRRLPASLLLPCLAVVLLSAAVACAAPAFDGRVVGVADGDTITVLKDGHEQVKIRLSGIDAPERHQAFGQRAKEKTSELCFRKVVLVTPVTRDRYGRLVAEVRLPDGTSLNERLVREGYAWWYRHYSDERRFADAERAARQARRGLWSEANPVAPWDFRRARRPAREPR